MCSVLGTHYMQCFSVRPTPPRQRKWKEEERNNTENLQIDKETILISQLFTRTSFLRGHSMLGLFNTDKWSVRGQSIFNLFRWMTIPWFSLQYDFPNSKYDTRNLQLQLIHLNCVLQNSDQNQPQCTLVQPMYFFEALMWTPKHLWMWLAWFIGLRTGKCFIETAEQKI